MDKLQVTLSKKEYETILLALKDSIECEMIANPNRAKVRRMKNLTGKIIASRNKQMSENRSNGAKKAWQTMRNRSAAAKKAWEKRWAAQADDLSGEEAREYIASRAAA